MLGIRNTEMKIFIGKVSSSTFGVAAKNLARVMHLIEARMGLVNLVPGTLNIRIPEEYIVIADATISPHEYGFAETIKLQRCLISGFKAIIMRPDTHETRPNWGHGKNHLELMSPFYLRSALNLKDGDEVIVQVEGDEDWWKSGK
jgi:CTP-dependent riboflavin kinase